MIERTIHNKKICIVDEHNETLIPWSKYRCISSTAPILLTMDHHTDLHQAFLKKSFDMNIGRINQKCQENLIARTKYTDSESVRKAVCDIKNDEQIMTAIETNIISEAFVVAYAQDSGDRPTSQEQNKETQYFEEYGCLYYMLQGNSEGNDLSGIGVPDPPKHEHPYHYYYPEDKVFVPDWNQLDQDIFQDKEAMLDYVIDDLFLSLILSKFYEMIQKRFREKYSFSVDYILDIDLDYFSTNKALHPQNKQLFYSLIRSASLITIAKESYFVAECSNHELTSDVVLENLLSHIEQALVKFGES